VRTSERGIALNKGFEGFSSKAYYCPAGKLTIGHGTTSGVRAGMTVTKEEAHALLLKDLRRVEAAISELVTVHLSQEQFDALVSLVYNIGEGNFRKSTLLKRLNEGKYRDAAVQFTRWVHAGKKKLPGLVARRKAEKELFLEGTSSEPLKPLSRSREIVGSTVAAVGTAGDVVLTEAKDAIEPVIGYSDILRYVFIALVLAGIALTVYGRVSNRRKGIV
jgi:lysozyme